MLWLSLQLIHTSPFLAYLLSPPPFLIFCHSLSPGLINSQTVHAKNFFLLVQQSCPLMSFLLIRSHHSFATQAKSKSYCHPWFTHFLHPLYSITFKTQNYLTFNISYYCYIWKTKWLPLHSAQTYLHTSASSTWQTSLSSHSDAYYLVLSWPTQKRAFSQPYARWNS